jgi:2,4-dienoyl-CoA reductase-like NADH-dependent reductase (Old Yellow Enzyme family)
MTTWGTPLHCRSLQLKNRILRASRAYPTGAGDEWRSLDWELEYARAGVGAIISARAEVCAPSRPHPDVLTIHGDEAIARWQRHVGRVHAYRCRYLIRLGHGQVSPERLSLDEVRDVVRAFGEAGRRARETGADGVEIDGAEGSLIAQYLAPGVADDRPEAYRGALEQRARLARQIARGVRYHVGSDFHVQVRLGVSSPLGMMAAGVIQVLAWLEQEGIDAVHVNANAVAGRYLKEAARVPVLRGGRFESETAAGAALTDGSCDAVALVRPLELPPREVVAPWRPAA